MCWSKFEQCNKYYKKHNVKGGLLGRTCAMSRNFNIPVMCVIAVHNNFAVLLPVTNGAVTHGYLVTLLPAPVLRLGR
jgi:hypothetical protein